MAQYTYLAADLRTNIVLAELPLTAVTAGVRLNGAGQFKGELSLQGVTAAQAGELLNASQPSRTALYIDRDGALEWGGIIWKRGPYRASTRKMEIAGDEFFSYFHHRNIRATLPYAQRDQLFIARDLVNYAQAFPPGNIGIAVGNELSGVLRDRTYYNYEQKNIGDAITELSAVENGFDFAVDVFYDSQGRPSKAFNLGYPRRGRVWDATGHVFEMPGNIVDYGWPEDGYTMANTILASGAGSQETQLLSMAITTDFAGYPLLDGVRSYKDVSVQSTLDDHAAADLFAANGPVTIPELDVRADMDPKLGEYIAGDDAQIRIDDPIRFPGGLLAYQRIVGYDITPSDAAGTAENVKIICGPVT